MKSFLFLPLLFLATSCFGQNFFPPGALASTPDGDEFIVCWFSNQFAALRERPLYSVRPDSDAECYRFTWLRTFDRPVALQLDVPKDGAGIFTIRVTDGMGGYDPGRLVRNETRRVSDTVVMFFRSLFADTGFAGLVPFDESRIGTDGAEWIVEALVDGRYRIVHRWSPDGGLVRRIGMEFLHLAIGPDFAPIY